MKYDKLGCYAKTQYYTAKVVWVGKYNHVMVFKCPIDGEEVSLINGHTYSRYSWKTFITDPEIEAYISNPFFEIDLQKYISGNGLK